MTACERSSLHKDKALADLVPMKHFSRAAARDRVACLNLDGKGADISLVVIRFFVDPILIATTQSDMTIC
jgi:hypothetical protein